MAKISEYPQITEAKASDLLDISEDIGGGIYETKGITKGDLLKPKVLAVPFSVAPIFDVEEIYVQELDFLGSTSPALANKVPGGTYIITFQTDATGGYAITPGASFGTKDDSSADVVSAAANALYIFTVVVRPSGLTFYTINTIGV